MRPAHCCCTTVPPRTRSTPTMRRSDVCSPSRTTPSPSTSADRWFRCRTRPPSPGPCWKPSSTPWRPGRSATPIRVPGCASASVEGRGRGREAGAMSPTARRASRRPALDGRTSGADDPGVAALPAGAASQLPSARQEGVVPRAPAQDRSRHTTASTSETPDSGDGAALPSQGPPPSTRKDRVPTQGAGREPAAEAGLLPNAPAEDPDRPPRQRRPRQKSAQVEGGAGSRAGLTDPGPRPTVGASAHPSPEGAAWAGPGSPGQAAPGESSPGEASQPSVKEPEGREPTPHAPAEGGSTTSYSEPAPVREALERLQRLAPDDPERLRLREQVVESHLPLVRVLAQRYRDLGEPLDDLVQVGTIGLIHAVDRFDPDRGTGLASYATPNILGEIRRHFRDRAWAVRVPRRLQELQARTSVARENLAQSLGRSPTVRELAQAMGLEEEAVLEGLEAQRAYAAVPLERPEGQVTVDGALVIVDSGLEDVVDRESLRPVLRNLPSREKRILALRYFRGLSQAQIAEELGISQMHVSRLLARTLSRLQQCLIEGGEAAADVGSRPGRPGTAPGSPAGSSAGSAPAAAAGAGRTARPPQPRRAPASERRADPVRSDSLRAEACRTGARAVRRAG